MSIPWFSAPGLRRPHIHARSVLDNSIHGIVDALPGLVADQLHLVFEQHRCSFAPCPPHLILEMGVKHMEELLTRLVQRKPRNHSIVKAFFTHLSG